MEQLDVKHEGNPKLYLDSRTIPFFALPRDFTERFGIALGDMLVVFNEANGRSAYAIYADVGPRGRIGEGSIALAKALGMSADPRHGQAFGHITYLIFPSSGAAGWNRITPTRIRSAAAKLHHQWIRE